MWHALLALSILHAAPAAEYTRSDIAFAVMPAAGIFVDLDGDGRQELIAVAPSRQTSVFRQQADGRFSPTPDTQTALRPDTWAICSADLLPAPGAELLQLAPVGVFVSVVKDGKLTSETRLLVPLQGQLAHDPGCGLTTWEFARDVDGDGVAELIVPAPPEVVIYKRQASGAFAPAHRIEIEVRPEARLAASVPGLRLPWGHPAQGRITLRPQVQADIGAIEVVDVDRDGVLDLVIGKEAFLRQPDGSYRRRDEALEAVSFWGACRLIFDIDGDGQFDKVIQHFHRPILRSPITTLRIALESKDSADKPRAQYRLRVKGMPYWRRPFVDANGDGKLDLVMLVLDVGSRSIGSLVERALVRGFKYDLAFYIFDPERGYASKPTYTKTFRVHANEAIGNFPQADTTYDLNGDGLLDVFIPRKTKLEICFLRSLRRGYPNAPDATLALPSKLDSIAWKDINSDKFLDPIILSHKKKRLTVYVSEK